MESQRGSRANTAGALAAMLSGDGSDFQRCAVCPHSRTLDLQLPNPAGSVQVVVRPAIKLVCCYFITIIVLLL